MSSDQTVFAVGAHPDDIEFNMAGTLAHLAQAGFEPHMMNLARSNLDSNTLSEAEITRIRLAEAEAAAAVLGAVYHPPIVDDLMIFYDDTLLRQMTAIVREIRPAIVLLLSGAISDAVAGHGTLQLDEACAGKARAPLCRVGPAIHAPRTAEFPPGVFQHCIQAEIQRRDSDLALAGGELRRTDLPVAVGVNRSDSQGCDLW